MMQKSQEAELCFKCGKWFESKQRLWDHRRAMHPESVTREAGARARQPSSARSMPISSVPPLMSIQMNPRARIASINAGSRPSFQPLVIDIKEEAKAMKELKLEHGSQLGRTRPSFAEASNPSPAPLNNPQLGRTRPSFAEASNPSPAPLNNPQLGRTRPSFAEASNPSSAPPNNPQLGRTRPSFAEASNPSPAHPDNPSSPPYTRQLHRMTEMIEMCHRWSREFTAKQVFAMLMATFPDVEREVKDAAAFGMARARQSETAVTIAMDAMKARTAAEVPEICNGAMSTEALTDADFMDLLDAWVDPPMVYEDISPPAAQGRSDEP